jgi:hypothetical protein
MKKFISAVITLLMMATAALGHSLVGRQPTTRLYPVFPFPGIENGYQCLPGTPSPGSGSARAKRPVKPEAISGRKKFSKKK